MSETREETFLETLARYQREYNEANPEWFAAWTVRCAAAEQATAKLDELKKASHEATRAMLDAGDNMTDEIWKNFTSTYDAVAEFKAQNPDAGVLLIHPACRELRTDMVMGKVRPAKQENEMQTPTSCPARCTHGKGFNCRQCWPTPKTTTEVLKHASAGEAKMARKLVKEILDRGLKVSVNDGEEWVVHRSTDKQEILAALCSTGEDHIRVRDDQSQCLGSFYLVWGNAENGEELVADHTDNEFCNEVWNKIFG